MKAVTLLSGGLDSTTLAYQLKSDGYNLHCLSFDYGQRHRNELVRAEIIAGQLGVTHDVVALRVFNEANQLFPLSEVLKGSSLTDSSVPVPEGHYAEDSMKATVVPNRNAIMLSIAYGIAVAEEADLVAFAAHAGDHTIYPDCRPEFVNYLAEALRLGNEWAQPKPPSLEGPFLHLSKADIVTLAHNIDVPLALTWSCYKGGDIHCGMCGTCVERKEAFREAGVFDPTKYEEPSFMVEAYVGT